MPAPITLNYDLDRGTFSQQPGQAHDTYTSTTIFFAPVTLTTEDRLLNIQVNFIEDENGAAEQMELRTLGTGAGENLPSTFGTKIGTGHEFGPGMILAGPSMSGFEGMNLKATPTEVTGPLKAEYATVRTGAISGHGDPNSFEFGFGGMPDMLDDPYQPLRFGGFTLELEYAGGEPSVTIDQLTFNTLSAEVDIRRSPGQLERIDDPLQQVFHGDEGVNQLSVVDGYNVFFGEGGNDLFFGGKGPDVAYGGDGDDILVMEGGRNTAYGDAGSDTIVATGSGGSVLHGGGDNDEITGSFDNDVIQGGDGDDRMIPLYGNDVLTGWNGADVFVFSGDLRIDYRGIGDDIIDDFGRGTDLIEIETFFTPGFASFADVAANLVDGPNGAILTIPDEGTITFLGVPVAGLDTTDFIFT
jgi:Ca2+-binding RTX toxin-like protein